MRIVFWNCNQALHNKLPRLLDLEPDVAVIPECAQPEIVQAKAPLLAPPSSVWVGENPQKGLGIFGFGDYRVTLDPCHNPALRFIAPVQVEGPVPFHLVAVWARYDDRAQLGYGREYIGSLLRGLDAYADFIGAAPTIIGGDFNNNVQWDKPGKANNHANAVARLESLGLFSGYHHHRGLEQGQEPEPTHYWRDRKKDGWTYHIDHCFLPEQWQVAMRGFEVGSFEDWIGQSDHVPLAVDLDAHQLEQEDRADLEGVSYGG